MRPIRNKPVIFIVLYSVTIIFFSIVYYLLPDSYFHIPNIKPGNTELTYTDSFYFSVVTISSLGFGEIFPISSESKLLVSLEVIIGLTLMGLFVNSIFLNLESKRKVSIKKAMLRHLGIFVMWSETDILKNKSDWYLSDSYMEDLSSRLKKVGKLNNLSSNFLKSFAKREVSSIEALLPVAAELGPDHLLYWNAIVNQLKGLTEKEECKKNYEEYMFKCATELIDHMDVFRKLKTS